MLAEKKKTKNKKQAKPRLPVLNQAITYFADRD